MPAQRHPDERLLKAIPLALMLVTGVWLLVSLEWVRLDLDDGYSTMVNAWYFAGETDAFAWQRGPLLGLLLSPLVRIGEAAGLPRIDVRPAHALMVLLHLLYLIFAWRALAGWFGVRPAVVMAYLAAIPTVLYASYAPFISHDLFPGLLTLWLVCLADDYLAVPSRPRWLLLLALGFLLVCTKQTYALVWPAVLAANLVQIIARREGGHWRAYAGLVCAAAGSAVLTWLAYALTLSSEFPDFSFWWRPAVQIMNVANYYGVAGLSETLFYPWVYLRNLPAYGILASCLVLPGLYLGLRHGARLQRSIAICWILLATSVAMLGTREVRYLAFLAPMTAFLIVPAIDLLVQARSAYAGLLLAILAVDMGSAGREAVRIRDPYYSRTVSDFFGPILAAGPPKQRIHVVNVLSFMAPLPAFFGDRYHRITHINAQHIEALFGSPTRSVLNHVDLTTLTSADFADGDVLLFANNVIARAPPIAPDNRTNLRADFLQLLATSETLHFQRNGDRYELVAPEGKTGLFMLLRAPAGDGLPALAETSVALADLQRLTGTTPPPASVTLRGFRVESVCVATGCRSRGAQPSG